jgi:hypothetical protein
MFLAVATAHGLEDFAVFIEMFNPFTKSTIGNGAYYENSLHLLTSLVETGHVKHLVFAGIDVGDVSLVLARSHVSEAVISLGVCSGILIIRGVKIGKTFVAILVNNSLDRCWTMSCLHTL